MEELEHSAKTYQQAVDEALDKLDRDLEEVEIEVLSDGADGKPVKIRVTVKESVIDDAQDWLLDILDEMDMACSVGLIFEPDNIVFHIETDEDAGMLIGRRGQTLDALQYLLNVAYGPQIGRRLIVDVQDYRKRHQEKLIEQALSAADRVRTTGRPMRLPPMSAGDRRIVHQELQAYTDLETGSQGDDPNRFIVIYPKRNDSRQRSGTY